MGFYCKWYIRTYILLILLFFIQRVPYAQPNTLSEKEGWAKEVYANLATAMGLIDRPELVVDPYGRSSVAAIHYQKHQIVVDEQFVNVCWQQFPGRAADALAFVLGHELAHYVFQHHWGETFSSSYALTDIAQGMEAAQAQLKALPLWETQADQAGGIYAYLAGYQPGDIAATLLATIYDTYGFPEQMPGYPSLQDRVTIAQANNEQVNDWITIYETGNYATLAGAYEVADYCYAHVIQQGFSSREVLNNHAVALIQQALLGMDDKKVRFVYPVELDMETRLGSNTRGSSTPELLLNRARQRLMQAIWVDPEYATGWLNLACVQSLLGELDDAVFYAEKALLLARKYEQTATAANAQVVQGIHAALSGNNKEAQQYWNGAHKLGSTLAAINQQILAGTFDLSAMNTQPPASMPAVSIDGIHLAREWGQQPFLPEPILYGLRNLYACVDLPASDMFFFQVKDAAGWVFHATRPNYKGQLDIGIAVGTKNNVLETTWGRPTKIMATAQGQVWQYADKGLLITCNTDQEISGWITYLQSR